ncbi:hypothetical protein ACQP1O_24905 [Nocardia sp. CA-151230]|uniref:hypothetical protein n=1 Tax=Nocardia sp. CA-151230 TaxID=3239982 RepID=UPI003D8CCA1B
MSGVGRAVDLRTLSSPPGTWDAVVAFSPLLQLIRTEIDAALRKFVEWLTPAGLFLLATAPADIEGLDIEFMGRAVTVGSYPVEELQRRLSDLGLDVVRERVVEFRPDHPSAMVEHDLFLAARRSAP